jgi:hypothetical protein
MPAVWQLLIEEKLNERKKGDLPTWAMLVDRQWRKYRHTQLRVPATFNENLQRNMMAGMVWLATEDTWRFVSLLPDNTHWSSSDLQI